MMELHYLVFNSIMDKSVHKQQQQQQLKLILSFRLKGWFNWFISRYCLANLFSCSYPQCFWECFTWMNIFYGGCFIWMNVLHGWMFYIDGCLTWMESIIGKSVQQQLHPALLKLIFRVNDLTILHNGWNNKNKQKQQTAKNKQQTTMFDIGLYWLLEMIHMIWCLVLVYIVFGKLFWMIRRLIFAEETCFWLIQRKAIVDLSGFQ